MMSVIKEWTKPAGLAILCGLIIWLGQLNWHALQATAKNAEQDQIQQEILAKQVAVSANVQQSALLLSILMEEMKEIQKEVGAHNAEAEMWKERIRNLSSDHHDKK